MCGIYLLSIYQQWLEEPVSLSFPSSWLGIICQMSYPFIRVLSCRRVKRICTSDGSVVIYIVLVPSGSLGLVALLLRREISLCKIALGVAGNGNALGANRFRGEAAAGSEHGGLCLWVAADPSLPGCFSTVTYSWSHLCPYRAA